MAKPNTSSNQRIPSWALWLIWLVVPILLGLLSVKLGATFAWDARMYHYYNGFAFLEDRVGQDLAPAARQSFHNPLPDVVFYLAYRYLFGPPGGFLLGVLHGLNFPLLVWLIWVVLAPAAGDRRRIVFALGLGALGTLHQSFLVQVGGAAADNIVSLFVLGALAILLGSGRFDRADPASTLLRVGVAGFCLGAAFGLKLTAAVFCVGAGLAILVLPAPNWVGRLTRLAVLTAGGLTGAVATSGFWAFKLWRLTGNPFFPYLNQVFDSPLVAGHSFEYRDFLSTETLLWSDPDVINQELWALRTVATDDVRYPIVALLLCVVLVVRFFNRKPPVDVLVDRASGLFLVVFCCASFVVWLKVFAITRYLLPLGLLAPILVVTLLDRATDRGWVRFGGIAIVSVLVMATLTLAGPLRVPWHPNPYSIDFGGFDLPDDATVVMIDLEPIAYMIPSFPRGVRFVRPGGNLFLQPWHRLHQIMIGVIHGSSGPNFTLRADRTWGRFSPDDVLASVGLEKDDGACVILRTAGQLPEVRLCPAVVRPGTTREGQAGSGPGPSPGNSAEPPVE